MGLARSAISFAAEVAVALLADAGRDAVDDDERPEDDVFYDPNGAAHAHLLDVRGIPMDRDWFDGRH